MLIDATIAQISAQNYYHEVSGSRYSIWISQSQVPEFINSQCSNWAPIWQRVVRKSSIDTIVPHYTVLYRRAALKGRDKWMGRDGTARRRRRIWIWNAFVYNRNMKPTYAYYACRYEFELQYCTLQNAGDEAYSTMLVHCNTINYQSVLQLRVLYTFLRYFSCINESFKCMWDRIFALVSFQLEFFV